MGTKEYITNITFENKIEDFKPDVLDGGMFKQSIKDDFIEYIKNKAFIPTLKNKIEGGNTRTSKFKTRVFSFDDYLKRKEYILSSICLEFFNEWLTDTSSFELYIDEMFYSHISTPDFCPLPGIIIQYTKYYA